MLLASYIAACVSIICHVFINLAYSIKFDRMSETHWIRACVIALFLDLILLDVIRCAVATIVELRRFEIRRRQQSGDFLKSRMRTQAGAGKKPEMEGRKPPPKRPAVPNVPPKAPLTKSAPP